MSDEEKIKQLKNKSKDQEKIIKEMYLWQKKIVGELGEIRVQMKDLVTLMKK